MTLLTMAPMRHDPLFVGFVQTPTRLVALFDDGSVLPAVRGGDGDTPPPNPPSPPAPDLTALQQAIDAARNDADSAATGRLLQALGFDKLEDAQSWVTSKREEETAALTEVERRERAAEERERVAQQREADASRREREALVRAELVAQGASRDVLADLARLVALPEGDIDDAKVTAAVGAVKTKFGAMFTGTAIPPAPSGLPGGTPPPPPGGPQGIDPARERARRRFGVVTDKAS